MNCSSEFVHLGRLYLANFQFNTQQIDEAKLTLKHLDTVIETHGIWKGLSGMYWNLAGLIATESADYAYAIQCHRWALKLRRDANLNVDVAVSLNNLAYLAMRLGDYQKAILSLDEALTIHGTLSPPVREQHKDARCYARINYATALNGSGQSDQAIRMVKELLTSLPSDASAHLTSMCHINLGLWHYHRGELDLSRTELRRAYAGAKAAFGNEHVRVAECEVNLGWLAFETGNIESAQQHFESAVSMFQGEYGELHPRTSEAQTYLALVLKQRNELVQSRSLLTNALQSRESFVDDALRSAISSRERLAMIQEQRVHRESTSWPGPLDAYLASAETLEIPVKDQYQHVLKWKGAVSRHSLQTAIDRANLTDEIRNQIKKDAVAYAGTLQQLSELAYRRFDARDDPEKSDRLEVKVRVLEQEAHNLEREIRRRISADGIQDGGVPVTLDDVARALPDGSLLMEVLEIRQYAKRAQGEPIRGKRTYIAYLISSSGQIARVELGDADRIDDAVDRFTRSIYYRLPDDGAGKELADSVRDKLQDHLEGVRLLVIAGDGSFHRLPFAALPGAKEDFWVQELAFATVPSAHSLVMRRATPRAAATGWMIVGGVDYGMRDSAVASHRGLSFLPGTVKEAKEIEARFHSRYPDLVDTLETPGLIMGKSATKQAIRDGLLSCRYIHLATHGYFLRSDDYQANLYNRPAYYGSGRTSPLGLEPLDDEPFGRAPKRVSDQLAGFNIYDLGAQLDAGIALAPAKPDDASSTFLYDSVLSASELAELDLRHVELIVLSACETGLGYVQSGQGIVGLPGALDQAGARSVISSLWKVDDKPTVELMRHFYKELLQRDSPVGPAEALCNAQRAMIASKKYQKPRYWAAWSVMGDPGRLRTD